VAILRGVSVWCGRVEGWSSDVRGVGWGAARGWWRSSPIRAVSGGAGDVIAGYPVNGEASGGQPGTGLRRCEMARSGCTQWPVSCFLPAGLGRGKLASSDDVAGFMRVRLLTAGYYDSW
jgi:hypothetical protein